MMQVSVTDATGQLTDLVRRAEAGDEVVLTRHGRAAVRLVLMEAVQRSAASRRKPGPSAARSHDDLHDEDGLGK